MLGIQVRLARFLAFRLKGVGKCGGIPYIHPCAVMVSIGHIRPGAESHHIARLGRGFVCGVGVDNAMFFEGRDA